jgi:hypothetical protein
MAAETTGRQTYESDYIKGDFERAVFLGNPLIDHLFTALQSLGAEVWTNRRRMYVTEALLAQKGVTTEMIEKYMPTAEEEARWKADRDRMVKMMYAPFLRRADLNYASPQAMDYDPALGRAAEPPAK